MRSEDEDDFRRFTAQTWPKLVRTGYLLTGDLGHAEDLAQTALIKVYRSWQRIRDVEDVDAYVRKVLVNSNRDRFRSRRPAEFSVADPPEARTGGDPGPAVVQRDALIGALAALPPRQRAVVVLRFWEDLSEATVAELLGCTVGTVKSQTSRALAKLRADRGLAESGAVGVPEKISKGVD